MPTKLVALYDNRSIPANGSVISGQVDLTGFKEYRLALRVEGAAGTKFTINELYSPVGSVSQNNVDIASGTIDTFGSVNYRGKFAVYAPKVSIRLFNRGDSPIRVWGSLYAVECA